MFELGLRLAFDKPTIIVKDEKTSYSFDTGQIEHLEYPRDLRYQKIIEFQEKLAEKIRGTHDKATSDPAYTTFLKHFGEFKVAKIEKKEVPGQEFIIDELKSVRDAIQHLDKGLRIDRDLRERVRANSRDLDFRVDGANSGEIESAMGRMTQVSGVSVIAVRKHGDHHHIVVTPRANANRAALRKELQGLVPVGARTADQIAIPQVSNSTDNT